MRRGLYIAADRGLEPLSWGLFQDPGTTGLPLAKPIEKLPRDLWNPYMKTRKLLCGSSRQGHLRCTWWIITRRRHRRPAKQLYRKEEAIRQEQARHHGMLVCRAFFKFTMREHMSEEACGLSPEVVELVEQFLNR